MEDRSASGPIHPPWWNFTLFFLLVPSLRLAMDHSNSLTSENSAVEFSYPDWTMSHSAGLAIQILPWTWVGGPMAWLGGIRISLIGQQASIGGTRLPKQTHQTKTRYHGWSPTIPRMVTLEFLILPHSGSILDFKLSWKSGKFHFARCSLREAELGREPHPPTPPRRISHRVVP